MKSRKENLMIATIGAWWLSKVVVPVKAIEYCRAARRDERNGFPCTAAMEWRNAAELLASNALLAEHCWDQWERIMKLPRRLAGLIGDAPAVVTQKVVTAQFSKAAVTGEISFAHAA